MTDKARELLERALMLLDYSRKESDTLEMEILAFIDEPEPTQDEPVDISAKSGPTIVAMLPNGVAVSNVYEAYEAGLKEGSLQDGKPVAWLIPGGVTESKDLAIANGSNAKPLYLHPAPRSEFVRLSEEEVTEILTLAHTTYEAVCATENRLVEKNNINRSDPDSIDLQSRCRGDKL